MKWKLTGILVFLMLASSAMACHYWCFGVATAPTQANADVSAMPNQILKFTGQDPLATYTWVVRNENGAQVGSSVTTGPGETFYWTVPASGSTVYTVEWSAAVGYQDGVIQFSCVKSGCVKVFIVTMACVEIPDYCEGTDPNYQLTVTLPASVSGTITVEWDVDGTPIGTGNPFDWAGWNTLTAGTHYLSLKITQTVTLIDGTTMSSVIKLCSPGMAFEVQPKVVGEVVYS